MTDQPLDLHDIDPPDPLVQQLICDTGSFDAVHVLKALTIWADGALIDPQTWQRIETTQPGGLGYCPTHDEPSIEAYDPSGDCGHGCDTVPLFTLTPRSDW